MNRQPDPKSIPVIRRLLEERKINIEPTALKYSEPEVRSSFGGKIKNLESVLENSIARFPPKLLELVEESEHGVITVTHQIIVTRGAMQKELRGSYHRRTGQVLITAKAIKADNGVIEEEFLHLVDHLLGSNGHGRNLSEGAFVKKSLSRLSQKISALSKAEVLSDYGKTNPREWLAQAARFYLSEPELLRDLVPEMYSLMEEHWLNNAYWESVL